MARTILGVFLVLHGLVHLWYFVLARRLVEFQESMGWTGRSWLFTGLIGDGATRSLAAALYVVATIGFVAAGGGLLAGQSWWHPLALASAAFSAVVMVLFWDGSTQMIVRKGLVGLLINVAILVVVGLLGWPSLPR